MSDPAKLLLDLKIVRNGNRREITTSDGKYTFVMWDGAATDVACWKVPILRGGVEWVEIEAGCNALRSLLWSVCEAAGVE